MARSLNVYLNGLLTGILKQNKHGHISFTYSTDWLQNDASIPLSYSLPLKEKTYSAKDCQGFFAGVLPEEENRRIIASILGVSDKNDFALLEQIGGECAGAVCFLPHQSTYPIQENKYQALSTSELAEILRELPTKPLMAGQKDIRLSLAGAQNKLAVHIQNGIISLPLNNSASTHIIKPAIDRFPDIVENEVFCMNLAKQCGLQTASANAESVEDIDYLITKRYDRIYKPDQSIERVHQEDFCQALGYPPHLKYQNEGGPSISQCFELIRNISSAPAPDELTLLNTIIFNYLIGNNDAHSKNFSFIYQSNPYIARLAPLYDLISTAHYPDLSQKMAMKIGKKYLPKELRQEHWQQLWKEAGFTEAQARKRTLLFTEKVTSILKKITPENQTQEAVFSIITMRANSLIRLF
jgi:serine/threonine-protein kinase HipA